MDESAHFSSNTKELIGIAHEIALDLGNANLDTVHFILADSLSNREPSLKALFFTTEEDFMRYYNSKRTAESRILTGTQDVFLPLTNKAGRTIRKALVEKEKFREDLVQPYHLFLAMSRLDNTFPQLIQPTKDLYLTLLDFYKTKGCLLEKPTSITFFF